MPPTARIRHTNQHTTLMSHRKTRPQDFRVKLSAPRKFGRAFVDHLSRSGDLCWWRPASVPVIKKAGGEAGPTEKPASLDPGNDTTLI